MVTGFLVRTGIVVGSVYYSKKLGVWGNAQQSELLYTDIKRNVRPYLNDMEKQLPFSMPSLPAEGEVEFLFKHYYNNGVKRTFHFIEMLPCYAGQLVKKSSDLVSQYYHQATASTAAPAKTEQCQPTNK